MANSEEQSARLTAHGRSGRLTDVGCPDCRGVLAVDVLGEHAHLRFSCQVGHAFSQESLMSAKELQVEQALWSSIETYEEIKLLCQALADNAREAQRTEAAETFAQRAARAAEVSQSLRDLLSHDRPLGAPTETAQGAG